MSGIATVGSDDGDGRLMTKAELAKYLAISVRKVDLDVRRGLPYIWVGERKRFRLADALRFYDKP